MKWCYTDKKIHFDIKSKRGRNFNGNDGLDGRVFALVKLKDPDTDLKHLQRR